MDKHNNVGCCDCTPCGYYGCPITIVCPHSYTISASFVTATFGLILGPGGPTPLGGFFVAGTPPRSPATGPITTLMTAGTFGGVPAWLSPAISTGVADSSGQTVFVQVISRPNCFAGYCPLVKFWYDAAATVPATPYDWSWTGGGPTSGVDSDGNLFCSGLSGGSGGITIIGLQIDAADWHPT